MGKWKYEKKDGDLVFVECGCPPGPCLCFLDKEGDMLHISFFDCPNEKLIDIKN